MGLFWDLMQESQIAAQEQRAATLEQREIQLENQPLQTGQLVHKLVSKLEREFCEDIDGESILSASTSL
jgi:citrate lyase gamma subunit